MSRTGSGKNTPTIPSGLPARPSGPLPSFDRTSNYAAGNASSQSSAPLFRPRSVATPASSRPGWQQTHAPTVSALPAASTSAAQYAYAGYSAAQSYQAQADPYAQYYGNYSAETYGNAAVEVPQIKNPFVAPTQSGAGSGSAGWGGSLPDDPDMATQVQQWQNAYLTKDDSKKTEGNANLTPIGVKPIGPALSNQEIAAAAPSGSKAAAVVQGKDGKQATVVRSGGGKTWQDDSLLEWDPANPRLFIGNLAGEVTDDSLYKAFAKYPSIVKTKVVRDRKTTKSKGYGFVSFRDADDYMRAFKEMAGKYIGSHPVLIRKSHTEIKAVDPKKAKNNGRKNWDKKKDPTEAHTGAGIKKGQPKMRNGLKVLG